MKVIRFTPAIKQPADTLTKWWKRFSLITGSGSGACAAEPDVALSGDTEINSATLQPIWVSEISLNRSL